MHVGWEKMHIKSDLGWVELRIGNLPPHPDIGNYCLKSFFDRPSPHPKKKNGIMLGLAVNFLHTSVTGMEVWFQFVQETVLITEGCLHSCWAKNITEPKPAQIRIPKSGTTTLVTDWYSVHCHRLWQWRLPWGAAFPALWNGPLHCPALGQGQGFFPRGVQCRTSLTAVQEPDV